MAQKQSFTAAKYLRGKVSDFQLLNANLRTTLLDSGFRIGYWTTAGYWVEEDAVAKTLEQHEEVDGILYADENGSLDVLGEYFPPLLGEIMRANGLDRLQLGHAWWDTVPRADSVGGCQVWLYTDGVTEEVEPQQRIAQAREKTYLGWSLSDMYQGRESSGSVPVPWNEEQAIEALERMQHKADVSVGVTWDTLAHYLERTIEDDSSPGRGVATVTEIPDTLEFDAVLVQEIHRQDFRFIAGDELAFEMGIRFPDAAYALVVRQDGLLASLAIEGLSLYWPITDPIKLTWIHENWPKITNPTQP